MATYVKGNPVANATSYELSEKAADGTYSVLATGAQINFEVSALGLAIGDHVLVVKAKADSYTDSDYSNEVTYNVPSSWVVYSNAGTPTVADDNGTVTISGLTTGKPVVSFIQTSANFSYTFPATTELQGQHMIIIGAYGDSNIVALRQRSTTGTNLQKYDYATFGGAVITTDSSDAAKTIINQGDTIQVQWSDDTVSLYVNGTLYSSFNCSSIVKNTGWKKCAGFMTTNAWSSTIKLNNFTL